MTSLPSQPPVARPSNLTPGFLQLRGLSKRFGGVAALEGLDLNVCAGEIHAILGENGAGKSTLMKLLAGANHPDGGEITLAGEKVQFGSPRSAAQRGIGIVYQELSLFPDRSVLANLFANREPRRRGFVDRASMRAQALPVLHSVGLQVDLDAPVHALTIAEQQLVELSRVLLLTPKLLILDEPNSALNEPETRRLFAVLRDLRARGVTMLYVSHRLEEVLELADTITVLRNARHVWTRPRAEVTVPVLVEAMIGSSPTELFPPKAPARRADPAFEKALRVADLTVRAGVSQTTFTARRGEIVGLAGVEGSGVASVFRALFGLDHIEAGEVTFHDGRGAPRRPQSAARRGIGMVPADRRHQGLMLEHSISENLAHVSVGALAQRAWVSSKALSRPAQTMIDSLRIRGGGPATDVGSLSGGNQQKVVLGKWLLTQPHVILLDDPTRGIDVGAKHEIFTTMRELAADGRLLLFRSTELAELCGMCDRILVFYRGALAGEAPAAAFDTRSLLQAINTGVLPA